MLGFSHASLSSGLRPRRGFPLRAGCELFRPWHRPIAANNGRLTRTIVDFLRARAATSFAMVTRLAAFPIAALVSFASDSVAQLANFSVRQRAEMSWRQLAKLQRANGDPFQTDYFVADASQDTAHFAIASLIQHHLEGCAVFVLRLDGYSHYASESFGEVHSFTHLRELLLFELACDFYLVGLLDAVARVRKLVGQFTIVGHDDQALARSVEPTYGK
jgi:hypothetical protein